MGEFGKPLRKRWHFRALLLGTGVAGVVVAASSLKPIRLLEWTILDRLFHWRPAASLDRRIAIVTIGEDDIHFAGQWPMSDRLMAELLSKIVAGRPRAVGVDIYRDLPVEPGHSELQALWRSTSEIVGAEKVSPPTISPPPFLPESQVAAIDLLPDLDGSIRRGGVSLVGQEGLGVRLALDYLQAEGIALQEIDETRLTYGLGKAVLQPIQPGDGGYRSSELGGYQILINYRGQWRDSFETISMQAVLADVVSPEFFHDRIVLIGAEAPSLNDLHPTPQGNIWFAPAERMPGVAIHAHMASQLIAAALDGRPLLTPLSTPANALWIWGWALGSAAIGQQFLRARWLSGVGLLFLPIAIGAIAYGSFLYGWSITIFKPMLAVVLAAGTSIGIVFWERLQQYYQDLADYNRTLETRVRQRTLELVAANAKLMAANEEITQLNTCLQDENLRLGAELSVAQELQTMVLPRAAELEAIAELEIAAYMDPATEVGGDYYDIFRHGEETTICIGDVTGHGLESGVFMLMVQTAVRTLAASNVTDPVHFLDTLNRTLYANIERMGTDKNMTLAIAAYHQGRLRISGQHEETIIVRADGRIERIDTLDLGFPIGLETEIAGFIASKDVFLEPGDLVILYTDGITEAENPEKRLYGIERLCTVACQWRHCPPTEIIDRAIADLHAHLNNQKIDDDITMIAFKQRPRTGPPSPE